MPSWDPQNCLQTVPNVLWRPIEKHCPVQSALVTPSFWGRYFSKGQPGPHHAALGLLDRCPSCWPFWHLHGAGLMGGEPGPKEHAHCWLGLGSSRSICSGVPSPLCTATCSFHSLWTGLVLDAGLLQLLQNNQKWLHHDGTAVALGCRGAVLSVKVFRHFSPGRAEARPAEDTE